jgi:hypothetical protein
MHREATGHLVPIRRQPLAAERRVVSASAVFDRQALTHSGPTAEEAAEFVVALAKPCG